VEIDWFTFGAQIVNFAILVALLKRFLYGPILDAMDRRETAIAERLESARARQEDAEQEAQRYRAMQEDLRQERDARIAEAEREAEERRRELIQQAREDVEYLEGQWQDALRRKRASVLHAVSERALEETIALARRALTDLADADLESQTVDAFLRRLNALDDAAAADLDAAFQSAGGRATLRTAFPLPEDSRTRIASALENRVDDLDLAVETAPDIGFGVELRVEHRRIAWTLDGYLDRLLERVEDRLDAALRQAVSAPVSSASPVPSGTDER